MPAWNPQALGKEIRVWRARFQPFPEAARTPPGAPGATVVVWGEASQVRREEMEAFAHAFAPAFRSAFDAGRAASVGGQFLSQLQALAANPNQNPAPAIAPAVWYNSLDPWARNPKFRK